jgi:hypothetical protein
MDSQAWDARYAAAPDLVWTAQPNGSSSRS